MFSIIYIIYEKSLLCLSFCLFFGLSYAIRLFSEKALRLFVLSPTPRFLFRTDTFKLFEPEAFCKFRLSDKSLFFF